MPEEPSLSLVPMEVKGLMIDPASNHPIVILRDGESQLFLPIWIGIFEASAIQLELEGSERPRPMTHDLMRAMVEQLGCSVEKIVISDLQENTFFAEIHLDRGGERLVIDSRPSDAIALALRAKARILVAPHVLERAKAVEAPAPAEEDEEQLRKYLDGLDPDDLGKYKM